MSFNDKVYQGYLMLPLDQRGYTVFKTLLWDECVDCTATLNLAPEDLPLPLERYGCGLRRLVGLCHGLRREGRQLGLARGLSEEFRTR